MSILQLLSKKGSYLCSVVEKKPKLKKINIVVYPIFHLGARPGNASEKRYFDQDLKTE